MYVVCSLPYYVVENFCVLTQKEASHETLTENGERRC